MQDVIMLKPIFQERIWGKDKLKKVFNYEIPFEHTGECWAISAHPDGDCDILNGPLTGKKLSEVFSNYKYLFNHVEMKRFPLLTKILDASKDLSVQVHPEDTYARIHENDLGKTECWYILDAEKDAYIIYGHHAKSKEHLISMIHDQDWEHLLRKIPVKKGDFYYVPAGTIHALCQGILVLETQQSSNTTYRVYDYNRKDAQGKLRQLHIQQAIDVSHAPHIDYELNIKVEKTSDFEVTTFVSNDFFTVKKVDSKKQFIWHYEQFQLVSVIEGHGMIDDLHIKKGDHFILTSLKKHTLFQGELSLIISSL